MRGEKMKKYVHAARNSSAYTPRGQKKSNTPKGQKASNIYDEQEFDAYQRREIRLGLKSGLDVSWYADPKFDSQQMEEIRQGLESGIDVSQYADPEFDYVQMRKIREGLELGVDVSQYADPKFGPHQMEEIRLGLESGIDVSQYADLKFNGSQMEEIREGLDSNIDVSQYADPEFDWQRMGDIRRLLEKGLPTDYAKLSKNDKAKASWARVKKALDSGNYSSVTEIEDEFDLMTLEGSAANKLGISFEEANDGSITFKDHDGAAIASLTSQEYDNIVEDAIKNSSTRSSFTKAFATRLKHILGL